MPEKLAEAALDLSYPTGAISQSMMLRSGEDMLLQLRLLSIIRTIGRIGLLPNIVESA
jgi:hypothetical protein